MLFPVRSKGRRGWPFAVIPAKAGIRNRGAAANGRSRPIHARVHGFVGAAREPPVLTAWADNPAIVRLVGAAGRSRTTPTGWLRIGGMGTRRGQPQGVVPTGLNRRRVNRADPRRGARMRPLRAKCAKDNHGTRGPCFRRGGPSPGPPHNSRTARFTWKATRPLDSGLRRNDGIPGRRAAEGKSSPPSRCCSLSDRRDAGVGLSPE